MVLLYVADVSFLNTTAVPLLADVESRLGRLGRFQWAMAQERAATLGITPQDIVRRDRLRMGLFVMAQEISATLIVLSCTLGQTAVFGKNALRALAADLETGTGVEVRILEQE